MGAKGFPSAPVRPVVVTAAAVLFFLGGAYSAFQGVLVLFGAIGFLFVVAGLLILIGALEIYVGTQVMALRERGRTLGMIVAGVGAVLAILGARGAPATSIVPIAIDGFIIWALGSKKDAFRA